MRPETARLALRLSLLGLVAVLLQVTAVSQLTLFGANADLGPLVVASVGLMCGSLTGAVFGFGCGLFLDVALLQTLGISSLVYIAVGYAAGRLLELRDPQAALVPMAVGVGATAMATIGYTLLQLMLGASAPLSDLVGRGIIATILVNTLISVPVSVGVRRWLWPVLPEDPRRRRRRVQTVGMSPLTRA